MWLFFFTLFLQLSGLLGSYNEGTTKCGAELEFRAANSTGQEKGGTHIQAWAVAILLDDGFGDRIHCSGSIIDPTHILTAAHCLLPKEGGTVVNTSKLTVVVGADDPFSSDPEEQGTRYKVQSYGIHHKHDSNDRSAYYDIAILKTTKDIEFKKNVWPVCIPERINTNKEHLKKQSVKVIGYGPVTHNDQKNKTGLTHELDLAVQGSRYCNRNYTINETDPNYSLVQIELPNKFENPSVFCAQNQLTSEAVCVQDAGGPAVQLELVETEKYQNPRWVQVAIVHGSIDKCDNSHFSSIFVRLDEPDVLRWIYLMLFPDRVNEIDIDGSQDDDY